MAEGGEEAAAVSSSPDEDSERSEEVMSEVHLGCPPRFSGPFVSDFTFCLPSLTDDVNERCDGLVESGSSVVSGQAHGLDEDGDLVLPRRKKIYNVAIQHKITSTIPDVGLQVLYLSLEKRYNFSLDDLDVVANGYTHFRSFLKDEEECRRLGDAAFPCFVGEQIDLSGIPQYIREYERGKDLEIWKITYAAAKSPA